MSTTRNRLLRLRLLLLALAALCWTGPGRSAEPDRYLPADAEAVVHVNVRQVLDSALVRKHARPQVEKWIKDSKDAQQAIQITGLDPLEDIASITLSNAGQSADKTLVIVRGKFDLVKIDAAARAVAREKKEEIKISQVGKHSLYEVTQKSQTIYAAFPERDALVVSPSRDYVVAALEGKTGKVNKSLADALSAINGKETAWAAGLVSDDLKQTLKGVKPVAGIAPSLKAIVGSLTLTSTLAASGQVQTTNARAARDLNQLANNAKEMLNFLGQTNEELAPFVNEFLGSLKMATQKNDVHISFKFSEDIIEKAIKKIPKK